MTFYHSTSNKPTDKVKLSFYRTPLPYGQRGVSVTGLEDSGSPNSSCIGTISPEIRSGVGRPETQSEINGPASRMVPTGHRFSQASSESNGHQAIEGRDDDSIKGFSKAFESLLIDDDFGVSLRNHEPMDCEEDFGVSLRNHEPMDCEEDIQDIHELFSSTQTIPDEQHQRDNPEQEQMRLRSDEEPGLTDIDLNSLQGNNWLSLNVVDWLFFKMLHPFPHLKFLRGTAVIKLIEDLPANFLKNLGDFSFIIGPYLRKEHFSLVIIGMQEKKVYFYDPVSEEENEMNKILQAVRNQFPDPDPEWQIYKLKYLRQSDTYNCGVYTVICANWFIFGDHLTDDPSIAREMFTKLSESCRADPYNQQRI